MQNIIIIYGGRSCESDISVLTALSVNNAIKNEYATELVYLKGGKFYIGKKLQKIGSYCPFSHKKLTEVNFKGGKMYKKNSRFSGKKIDCAVVCCHGGEGENGCLAGLLEIAGIPYTSCGPLQSAVCMDKVFTKYLLRSFRLPALPFRQYKEGDKTDFLSEITYPCIIKPASLGSSIGITFAENEQEAVQKLKETLVFDRKLLIEPALRDFREYTCAVFSDDGKTVCSQIEEVISEHNFYGFDEKYRAGNVKRVYPAEIPAAVESKIYRICEKIYDLFEMKGVVRVDFLDDNGKIYVNEINTVPGSLSWYLFKGHGYDLASLVRRMIEEGIKKKKESDSIFCDFPSAVLREFRAGGKGKHGGKSEG